MNIKRMPIIEKATAILILVDNADEELVSFNSLLRSKSDSSITH